MMAMRFTSHSDGKAYVPTIDPFECWHRQSYRYHDGMRVNRRNVTQSAGPGGMARVKQDGVIHELADGSGWIFRLDKVAMDARRAHKAAQLEPEE